MSSLGVAGLLCTLSRLFLKLSRWVLVRMTRAWMSICGRWRVRLLVFWVLSGVIGAVWLMGSAENFGLWRGKEKATVLREQFIFSKSRLQILASLFSSSNQRASSETMRKSVPDRPLSESLSQALEALRSNREHSQSQQEWVADKIIFHDQCPVQDECILGKSRYSPAKDGHMPDINPQYMLPSTSNSDMILVKESQTTSCTRESVNSCQEYHKRLLKVISKMLWWIIVGVVVFVKGFSFCGCLSKPSDRQVQQQQQKYQPLNLKGNGRWRKNMLFICVSFGVLASVWIFLSMKADIDARKKETLTNMCDERARMLQDQFNVSMNHVHALAILVSTFHHGKHPSAIDQKTFAEYTARTSFERPLTSGVAYALRVPHSQREKFEQQHGWKIKKMETKDQSPVQDDYIPEKLDPSPDQDEYAPVVFSQETVSHIVSIDMMSGKEDRDNIIRARASGKGVLTSPFKLLKSNHLGVVLTFAVYNTELPPNATPEERIEATEGYLGASFDVPSLVEKLLHQLASKQTIIVNVYDMTNSSAPIRMYGPDTTCSGKMHISNLDFGDPTRKHEMCCRFKHEPPPPWSAITTSLGVAVIVLLLGHILYAAINRIEKVEDDYHEMSELKSRAEAADVAKSQFLATVSHEIRTPMNGVLGMLQMLMDTDLDARQQDFAMTAQASGKSLIALINEVLDQAKIESGRLELEAVPFDVRDGLDYVLSLFYDKSHVKGIELAGFISDQVPEVLIGDSRRFRQIITNLVGNSVKFTEGGHIFVSVHLVEEVKSSKDVGNRVLGKNPENGTNMSCNTLSGFHVVERWKSWESFKMFEVLTECTNAINLLVTVEDTGVGIPEDAQSRIFMPFMQADSSTSRTYGGTGIGLSISRCLVNLMGGEIGFVSKPGIGSTFSFTAVFSEGQRSSMDMEHQSDQTVSDFQGMRGLVIDGRSIRAEVTKYHLQRLGVHVEIAIDPKSALSSILNASNPSGKGHIDMVLVDKEAWGEGSGLAFPRPLIELWQSGELKNQESLPKMFLLATSLSPSEIDDLKSAGYVDSIIKPLRIRMMAACLRKALGVGNKGHQDNGRPPALRSLLSGKHILVVDDNAVNRKVAEGALNKYGAIVTCADNGRSAVAMLQPPHKFDACFMDVQMPEMDGFETTKQIRRLEHKVNELLESGEASRDLYGNKAHWHIPILAMTADVIQATHEECTRCGMDDYVSKPFEEVQLYSAVTRFFESDVVDAVS